MAVARPILSDGKGAAEVMHVHASIGPKASEMKIPDAGRSAAVAPQAMEVEIEVSSPRKGGEDALAFEDLPWQCLTCSPVDEGAEEGGPIQEELHLHADADAPMPEAEQAHAPQPEEACDAVAPEVASAAPMPGAAHAPGDALLQCLKLKQPMDQRVMQSLMLWPLRLPALLQCLKLKQPMHQRLMQCVMLWPLRVLMPLLHGRPRRTITTGSRRSWKEGRCCRLVNMKT